MERILTIMLVCLMCACQPEQSLRNSISIATDLSNSARYYESNLIGQVEKFIEANHQISSCSNDALKRVYQIYSILDSIQSKLVEVSGGYDKNGSLLSADKLGTAATLFKESSLRDKLDMQMTKLKELAVSDKTNMTNLVVMKVENDLRIFDFPYYQPDGLNNVSVIQFYNDLLLVKTSLLFSEIMYFEMLKSTGC